MLQLRLVNPERATRKLESVADEVVGDRLRRARIAVEQGQRLVVRARERMMFRIPPLELCVPLEHREIRDPHEPPCRLIDEAQFPAEVKPQEPEDARHFGGLAGPEQQCRSRTGERRQQVLRQELRDRRAHLAVGAEHDRGEAACPPTLDQLLELRDLATRQFALHTEEAHGGRTREDPELGATGQLRRLLDLEAEAEIGLVRAVAAVRLLPRHAPKRRLELDAPAFPPDANDDLLDQAEQELEIRERRFDVELGQFLKPVGAQVFVSEAAGDLVVALEPGDDEQLLVDLRALRQREEPAGLESRRDEEVARTLRRGLAHDRRLDVDETGGLHLLPDDRDRLCTRPDVSLQPLASQIEPAIPDAQRLVDALLVELERQRRRRADHVELVDLYLDLAGRHARIHRLGATPDDLTSCADDELVTQLVRGGGSRGGALRVEDELHEPAFVSQVDEDQPAVVAPARHPTCERDRTANVVGGQLAADCVAPRHLALRVSASCARATVSASLPPRRMVTPSARTIATVGAPVRPACVICPLNDLPA